jgi:hypothetical protein
MHCPARPVLEDPRRVAPIQLPQHTPFLHFSNAPRQLHVNKEAQVEAG